MSSNYPMSFRIEMVRRMTGPNAVSASRLATEVAASQPVLSGWLRDARAVGLDNYLRGDTLKAQAQRTPADKMRLVIEAAAIGDDKLGLFLRQQGLHQADLDAWKKDMLRGLLPTTTRPPGASTADKDKDKRIAELERDLNRKDRALAEAAALLILKKKAQALWGDEAENTRASRER